MNQILAELIVLPKLVYGKVAIVNLENNTYRLLKPSINTSIQDDFDPMNYAILKDPKYSECIVYSSRKEREQFLVHKQLKDMAEPKAEKLGYCPNCNSHKRVASFKR